MFGQELVKLTIMDLSFTILSTLAVDFIRAVFVRIMNNFWCWDLEKQFPQYGDFKIAENILHLVNNQGMVWMGMFFSPGLVVINLIKLAIMMYLRSWAVLTCNVPHEVVFRASRSNNFYLALLLTMLFLCVLPVGYAMVWIKPSWHCGPFSDHTRIYYIFTQSLKDALPQSMHEFLDYIASPFIIIPLLVLLILIIYYMISLTNALREANNDLKMQLRRERTEERRKMFQIADRKRRGGSGDSGDFEATPFGKWKKLLPMLPTSKSFDADTKDPIDKKDILASFIKKTIKVQEVPIDDATDTEQHDSLPEDINTQEHEKKVLMNLKRMIEAKKQIPKSNSSSKLDKSPRKRHQMQKKTERFKSSSKSSSSKDLRQDSINSNWSDNIPVIRISEIESTDCILEHQSDSLQRKLRHQRNIDDSELQITETQGPNSHSSTETLVTVKSSQEGKTKKFDGIRVSKSIDTQQSIDLQKSSNSDTKTESSSQYQE